ncbi:MAG: hypothetical protein QMC95_16400 [Desulfitobacteriaceae bacterium]|nr:hypothetical protein [Desulfitobacteriaceae bacterium]MDI6878543.1 hypothetical protein [Desulfitobacteriaceae bacterium]MDI6915770.1 hypothetical protein [Desulfitobacteriaceae bacterium]
MAAHSLQYKNGGNVPEGVGLLISILLRYAEVGSVYYWPERQALKFTFMLMGEADIERLRNNLPLALEVYHQLEGHTMHDCEIGCRSEDNIHVLTIVRDVDSMTQNEVGLIVDFVKRECAEFLVCDEVNLPEDELQFQEELIDHMLANIHNNVMDKNVVAVREEGRVLVFRN